MHTVEVIKMDRKYSNKITFSLINKKSEYDVAYCMIYIMLENVK